MRGEIQLILACSRRELDAVQAGRIRSLLQDELDWVYLIRFATVHRLLPLVYRSLRSVAPDLVAESILQQLARYSDRCSRRGQALLEDLFELIATLQSKGIGVLPYKGPVLGFLAYGDPMVREFNDLDLLIKPEDVAQARKILVDSGFNFYLEDDPHTVFRRAKTQVELHWQFFSDKHHFRIDPDHYWSRRYTVMLGKMPVSTLPIEDWVLILSVHAGKHGFGQLSWICDIAELIRTHPGLDWTQLVCTARQSGCKRLLSVALVLSQRMFALPVPRTVLRRLGCGWLERSFAAATIRVLLSQASRSTELAHRRLSTMMLADPGSIVRNLLKANSEDRKFVRLPKLLSFLYVFVRPIRLLRLYGTPNLSYFTTYLQGIFRSKGISVDS